MYKISTNVLFDDQFTGSWIEFIWNVSLLCVFVTSGPSVTLFKLIMRILVSNFEHVIKLIISLVIH